MVLGSRGSVGREILVFVTLGVFLLALFIAHYGFVRDLSITGKAVDFEAPPPMVVKPAFDITLSENLQCWKDSGVKREDFLIAGHLLDEIPCISLRESNAPFSLNRDDECVVLNTESGNTKFCENGVETTLHEEEKIRTLATSFEEEKPKKNFSGELFLAIFILGVIVMVWHQYEVGFGYGRTVSVKQRVSVPLYPRVRAPIEIKPSGQIIAVKKNEGYVIVEDGLKRFRSLVALVEIELQKNSEEARKIYLQMQKLFSQLSPFLHGDERQRMHEELRHIYVQLRQKELAGRVGKLIQKVYGASRTDVHDQPKETLAKNDEEIQHFKKELPLSAEKREEAMRLLGEALQALHNDKKGALDKYRKFRDLVTTLK